MAGVLIASNRAKRAGLDPDSFFWFFVLLLVGGIAGGRLVYVALNSEYYHDLLSIVDTREGGLSIHGVLLGGVVAMAAYSKTKGIPFALLADVIAPGVILGQAIGRIGCFFSGCCYGIQTSGTWGFLTRFAPGLRHPYQLYESAADFALFALLIYLSSKVRFQGALFASYVMGYSIIRFALEFFRDNDAYLAGLSYGQWAAILGAAAGVGLYSWFGKHSSRTPDHAA